LLSADAVRLAQSMFVLALRRCGKGFNHREHRRSPRRHGEHQSSTSSSIRNLAFIAFVSCVFFAQARAVETELRNEALRVRITADGSYVIVAGNNSPIIRAGIAAKVDHRWIKSAEYPRHDVVDSDFESALGHGRQAKVTFTGLANQPDLVYTIRIFSSRPFGEIRVEVQNHSGRTFEVQSLRSVDALGNAILDLHASEAADRVLSDSFSEDWPPLQI